LKISRATLFFIILFGSFHVHSITIYGHRGARGLAPENTLPAYKVALMQGVDYVDLDVAMTKDGVVVVQHDLTLNPDLTRDSTGNWIKNDELVVKNLTLKQLQTYDVGKIKPKTDYAALFPAQIPVNHTRIPTLRQVIHYVKSIAGDSVGFQIEIKTDPTQPNLSVTPQKIVLALEKIIKEEGIVNRTKIQAFDWRCLLLLQKINPKIKTAYITDINLEKTMLNTDPSIAGQWSAGKLLKDYHSSIPEMINTLGGKSWDAQDIQMTSEKVKEAHRLGLKIDVWSSPSYSGKDVDVVLIKKLIAMHVDGIITDRPDIVKNLMVHQ